MRPAGPGFAKGCSEEEVIVQIAWKGYYLKVRFFVGDSDRGLPENKTGRIIFSS
jgi:hypothetical protein